MGFWDFLKPGGDTIKGALEGAGTLAKDIRAAITGDISSEKKAELAVRAQELSTQITLAQSKINEQEAKSSSLFIGGWRPFIGWVCGIGLAYHFLVRPLFYDLFYEYLSFELQPVDSGSLMSLVVALLGLGVMRSVEKAKDVQANH